MLEKWDPMAGDENEILRSKKAKALENVTKYHSEITYDEVPYEYHTYPTWYYVPTWNTTTTTATGWINTWYTNTSGGN